MRRTLVAVVVLVGMVACGPGAADLAGEAPAATFASLPAVEDTQLPGVTIESWCANQTPDRCVEGLAYLDENPEYEPCVLTKINPDGLFWDACESVPVDEVPVTTIPTEESERAAAAAAAAYQENLTLRLPELDRRAKELLQETHPLGSVTVGVVFATPVDLASAQDIAEGVGGTLLVAWRTDYVCLPGIDDWPIWTARRFAFLDGVERAAQTGQEMENSTTPVTGAHIPLNALAVMEQAAVALREPGVSLEAMEAEVPVAMLESLESDARVSHIRIASFPVEWLDLSELMVPDCEGG